MGHDSVSEISPMKHCNLCGRAVAANAYRVFQRKHKPDGKGLTICAECQQNKPRCLVCQTPMTAQHLRAGICRECLREGLKCKLCGKKIAGDFLLLNGNDGPYCAHCFQKFAPCDICSAPAGDDGVTLADGRVLCARCHQTAIADPREANELFAQVIATLDHSLGMRLNLQPQLMLVDHARLVELARTTTSENGHDAERVLGLFARQGRKRFIYLQEHLPRILLIQVVAHEFAHAWQGEQAPLLTDNLVREGFAEWVAYKMLQELGAQKKAAQMLQRQDVYGQGLRDMLQVERQRSIMGVLQSLRAKQIGAIVQS
ncbi:MAG: hypothetical protein B6D41_00315 [Chloroflexi bacterium UTCFX4]|nr:MAG: hypothetical protein B6D41_00315 [Chloroflexi bacterium UTCFX4]